ncbi:MAG: hypothetical protein KDB37_06595 [Ilumatobacter sp.]|nr:hypothetical protein [Ilumatobacter sp.]
MGLVDRVKRIFGRGAPETVSAEPTADDLKIGDLSERLRQMRGENVTAMGPGQAPPRSPDAVEQMSKAAADARGADQLSEDDVLRDVKQYRARGD